MIYLLGIALAMDALALSIVNGLRFKNYKNKEIIKTSLVFGLFQGLMPLLGALIFSRFSSIIEGIDHWIILIILSFIGIKMILDSFKKEEINETEEKFDNKLLISEAIASSIDALSSGIYLLSLPTNIYYSAFIIFIETAIICLFGHKLGKKLSLILKDKATIFGGIVLIAIGIVTLLKHLGIIS